MTSSVETWVEEVSRTTHPDRVVWCDGSDAENEHLISHMLEDGTLIRLNEQKLPNCYLHRSNP
ncbi:MAG: phosphoenolpyruvate carboxykinase, partial [Chloroflexi bacterium]|nr:phosphoenolpyruvate carboxykinase [Chloroflexota bacterium]